MDFPDDIFQIIESSTDHDVKNELGTFEELSDELSRFHTEFHQREIKNRMSRILSLIFIKNRNELDRDGHNVDDDNIEEIEELYLLWDEFNNWNGFKDGKFNFPEKKSKRLRYLFEKHLGIFSGNYINKEREKLRIEIRMLIHFVGVVENEGQRIKSGIDCEDAFGRVVLECRSVVNANCSILLNPKAILSNQVSEKDKLLGSVLPYVKRLKDQRLIVFLKELSELDSPMKKVRELTLESEQRANIVM